MFTRITHIILSVWLSLLLVFGNTAKEFIHLFTGHEDTVHAMHVADGELSFENEHHHCTFLSFALPDYYHDTSVFVFETFTRVYTGYLSDIPSFFSQQEIIRALLRGPPVA